ncbi:MULTISPECIES: hypothetical protein [Mycobacterium]|uniref:WXG100 family type VII secretion target n=2 Tax=Mycobacterium TaxID=1763 RepID=A0A498QUS6_9MYCO|nr:MULTISPECIES: hypothetical protein [Mycobacterium]KZS81575.1 hypothetical protein A4G31_23195 [Mycobacterium persicum]MBY0390650.1 hypothetical protein [Mycobacterium pseudokansasii]ORB46565.1 hypothetical protein BST40_18475 [Mycobacterium persicum]ORB91810.1 hypothetical protein B1T49_24100 [Mycobacterium persicum]ORB97177.1 hypothetical protein B1T44_24765 [Mycobacterium persicum]
MFQLSPEEWMSSAVHVTGQGEGLATAHLTSDYRLQSAQVGWQGASATALDAKLGDWLEVSRALLTRVGDHARGLHEAAVRHAAAEEERAHALARVGASAVGTTRQV